MHEPVHGRATGLPWVPAVPSSTGLFSIHAQGEFLARFTHVMGVLLRSGRSVPRALELVAGGSEAAGRRRELAELARRVNDGHALSAAMDAQPDVFPEFLREAVRAGEAAGRLPAVMERLAAVLRMRREAREQIASGLAYPATVLVLLCGVMHFFAAAIIPKFERIFAQHGATLPPITRFAFQDLAPWLSRPLMALLAFVGLWLVDRYLLRGRILSGLLDTLAFWTPVYRAVHGQYLVGWFSSLASVLVGGGIPVPRALALAAAASGSRVYTRMLARVHGDVEAGIPLREAIARSPAFPPDARVLLAAGDETNTLEDAFATVARLYHQRLTAELRVITGILEPCCILLLGGAIAVFCIATYLPIFKMSQTVSGHR
jgi:type IV pilus assembly protein PilC